MAKLLHSAPTIRDVKCRAKMNSTVVVPITSLQHMVRTLSVAVLRHRSDAVLIIFLLLEVQIWKDVAVSIVHSVAAPITLPQRGDMGIWVADANTQNTDVVPTGTPRLLGQKIKAAPVILTSLGAVPMAFPSPKVHICKAAVVKTRNSNAAPMNRLRQKDQTLKDVIALLRNLVVVSMDKRRLKGRISKRAMKYRIIYKVS